MPLLHRLANGFADRYSDRICSHVRELTNAIPRTGVEGVMRDEHDRWLNSMQLRQPYWSEDAAYWWYAKDGNENDLRLAITGEFTFVRRDHLGAYTQSGAYSWDWWWRSGSRGLMYPEPKRPTKPDNWYLEADLADAAHPERWEITYR